ncbi:MAG: Zn-dependent alcohol dehydrogenase [Acidimicrobiales bacterium]|jgi:Zn-dependent alcohol dehydrogenase
MRAAVLTEGADTLELLDDIEIAAPSAGQVLVDVTYCGICHSDMTIIDGGIGPLPIILGHEASGVVNAVGPGVTAVAPGDHVVLVAIAPCGRCYWCVRGKSTMCEKAMSFITGTLPDGTTALSRSGAPVYRGLGVGGFGEQVLTTESGAVRIDSDVPLDLACVIGCAIQTGVGAVLNTAGVEEGATVLVMGLGGVGISIVQGARIAGASRIIASDPLVERREAALSFGATDVLDPGTDDVVAACHDLTGVGVDYAFDAAGSARLIEAGVLATCSGGTTVSVGAPDPAEMLTNLPAILFAITEKRLVGCLYGSGNPHWQIPRLVSLWRRGLLDLEGMISCRRPLQEINDGFDDLRAGRGLRTVLTL